GTEVDFYAFVFEDGFYRRRDVLVFAADQAVALLDHGYLRAEAAEHLREFQRDVAAADHDEMARQDIQIHHRGIGEKVDRVDAGEIGHRRTSAGVEENLVRAQHIVADANPAGALEAGMAAKKRA